LLSLLLNFAIGEDFISEFEYGQMLYKDPRGVSCASCHGKLGESSFIASFKDKNGTVKKFYSPDIRKLSLERFKKALNSGGKLMPKYYLTNKEIEAIYKYINMVNSQSSEDNTTDEEDILSDENISDINESNLTNLYDEDENSTEDDSNSSIITKIFKTDVKE